MSPRTQPGLSHAMLEGVSRAWGIRGGGWGRAGSDPVAREPSYRGERRDELREGGRGGRQHVICFMATAHPVCSSGYKTPPAVAKRFPHSFWTGVGSHLGLNCHERCCTPVAKSSHIIVAHAGQKRQSFAEGGGRVAITVAVPASEPSATAVAQRCWSWRSWAGDGFVEEFGLPAR